MKNLNLTEKETELVAIALLSMRERMKSLGMEKEVAKITKLLEKIKEGS